MSASSVSLRVPSIDPTATLEDLNNIKKELTKAINDYKEICDNTKLDSTQRNECASLVNDLTRRKLSVDNQIRIMMARAADAAKLNTKKGGMRRTRNNKKHQKNKKNKSRSYKNKQRKSIIC